MVAPARTSHAEFTRNRSRAINEATAKTTVRVSTKDARPSSQVTAAINASDATFTPSRKAPADLDFRIRGTSGPLTATSRNAGRKMPTVEMTAPRIPPKNEANKRSRCENRSWRHLPHCNGIDKLRVRQPASMGDQIGSKEGQEHIAAAEYGCSQLQENQK